MGATDLRRNRYGSLNYQRREIDIDFLEIAMRTITFEEFHDESNDANGGDNPDEEVTVVRDGVPVAHLRPLSTRPKPAPEAAIRALREFRMREKISLGVS